MKRLLGVLYEVVVFYPLFVLFTLLTAVVTIVASLLWGNEKWGYYPGHIWSRITCALALVRIKREYKEELPATLSCVFVANHQSIFDVFLIYGWLNHNFKWVMKNEVRRIPLIGRACAAAGHIFIDRSHARAALGSLHEASRRLTDGNSVVIFPEGTRTHDGSIGRFRKGAFQLASELNLPIVPITIKGAFEVMPRTTYLPRPGSITMVMHPRIDTTGYNHDNIHELINKVHDTIESSL